MSEKQFASPSSHGLCVYVMYLCVCNVFALWHMWLFFASFCRWSCSRFRSFKWEVSSSAVLVLGQALGFCKAPRDCWVNFSPDNYPQDTSEYKDRQNSFAYIGSVWELSAGRSQRWAFFLFWVTSLFLKQAEPTKWTLKWLEQCEYFYMPDFFFSSDSLSVYNRCVYLQLSCRVFSLKQACVALRTLLHVQKH